MCMCAQTRTHVTRALRLQKVRQRAGEMVPRLKALAALADDLSSLLSIYVAAQSYL